MFENDSCSPKVYVSLCESLNECIHKTRVCHIINRFKGPGILEKPLFRTSCFMNHVIYVLTYSNTQGCFLGLGS